MAAAAKSKAVRPKRRAAAPKRDKNPKSGKKKVVRKRAAAVRRPSLVSALAQAAWIEADRAFALALADLDELEAARTEEERQVALVLLSQSLTQAARKRGLSRIGVLGETEAFDAKRHDLDASRKPKTVRIKARGVARGAEVLVKPRVGLVRRPRVRRKR